MLYRVIRQKYRSQGTGYRQEHGTEVLYCGQDREEAIRVYYTHEPEQAYAAPGNVGTDIRFQAIDPAELDDDEVESTTMADAELS